MLALSRKVGEGITIGKDVEIIILRTSRGRVQVGIKAPSTLKVLRSELSTRDQKNDRTR